jgi:hypothetical protein
MVSFLSSCQQFLAEEDCFGVKKFTLIFLALLPAIFLSGCGGSRGVVLQRADINELDDRLFYFTGVSVNPEKKGSRPVPEVDDPHFGSSIFRSLPVEAILNIIAREFRINIDVSEFAVADLSGDRDFWESDRKDVNSISVSFSPSELSRGFFSSTCYFANWLVITIRTKKGRSKIISIPSVADDGEYYNVCDIEEETGMKIGDILRVLIMRDLKKIPARLEMKLKEDHLIPEWIE